MDWKQRPVTLEPQIYNSNNVYGAPTEAQLAETHHHYYGRPWALGRCMFDALLSNGISPEHKILDFGCGSGRLAIWLVKFLSVGNYYGVEAHFESVDAFMRYEMPLHGLKEKCATVLHDSNINFGIFEVAFDVVVDAYSSVHLNQAQLSLFRNILAKHTKFDGLYITCPGPELIDHYPIAGFKLECTITTNCFLLSSSKKSVVTDWHIYRRAAIEAPG